MSGHQEQHRLFSAETSEKQENAECARAEAKTIEKEADNTITLEAKTSLVNPEIDSVFFNRFVDSNGKNNDSNNDTSKASDPVDNEARVFPLKRKDVYPNHQYHELLKCLNEDVVTWITHHVKNDPFCNLAPVFTDYERHLMNIRTTKSVQNSKSRISSNENAISDCQITDEKRESVIERCKSSSNIFITEGLSSEGKPSAQNADSSFLSVKPPLQTGSPSINVTDTLLRNDLDVSKSSTEASTCFEETIESIASCTESEWYMVTDADGEKDVEDSDECDECRIQEDTECEESSEDSREIERDEKGDSEDDEKEHQPHKHIPYLRERQENDEVDRGESELKNQKGLKEEVKTGISEPVFAPVVENGVVYSKRCKLYYNKHGNYIEKGTGTLYLKQLDTNAQLLVRENSSLGYVLLNVTLSSSLPAKKVGGNNVLIVCAPNPPIDPQKRKEKEAIAFLIRVKTENDADELLKEIERWKSV